MKKKKRKKRRQRIRQRIAASVALFSLLALIAVSVYFVKQYREDQLYLEYPLRYRDLIEQYAGEYGLDPALVAAVIRTESSFDPNAESYAGAIGLMQLTPDAGDWVAFRLGEKDYQVENLWDAEFNVRYGCWYWMYLSKIYEGDVRCMAAAYHGGPGAVDKWLEDPAYSSDGKTLDTIPYEQTSIYAETIVERYEIYKKLYYSDR